MIRTLAALAALLASGSACGAWAGNGPQPKDWDLTIDQSNLLGIAHHAIRSSGWACHSTERAEFTGADDEFAYISVKCMGSYSYLVKVRIGDHAKARAMPCTLAKAAFGAECWKPHGKVKPAAR